MFNCICMFKCSVLNDNLYCVSQITKTGFGHNYIIMMQIFIIFLKKFHFTVYRITVRRQRFIHYMTVCVDEYQSAGRCLTQLQKQKMLGVAHTYRISTTVHHVVHHTTFHSGFRIVGRKFNYGGHGELWNISSQTELDWTQQIFFILWL